MKMRLDFICPGVSKCGTTTLYNILRQHPQIALPRVAKEPLWLNDYDLCTNKGIDWYAEHYFGISEKYPQKDDVLYGEINPSFGVIPAKRLHDFFKDCKIIFMFRNPVERLWSHFNMNFQKLSVMLSNLEEEKLRESNSRSEAFSLFCDANFKRVGVRVKYTGTFNHILCQSGYEFNCKTYLKFFEKENVKIILFEDFIKETKAACKDLYEFLGIGDGSDNINYSLKSNIGSYNTMTKEEYKLLSDLEKRRTDLLVNGTEAELIAIREEIRAVNIKINSNAQKTIKEKPSQACIDMLQDYFLDDKNYVEEYLQRDLSDIWF